MQSTQVSWLTSPQVPNPPSQRSLEHHTCTGRKIGIVGAFDVWLSPVQLDELLKLGYTCSDETCLYCHEETTLVLHLIPDTLQGLWPKDPYP